jgi:large subunit ribosomal protein L30e
MKALGDEIDAVIKTGKIVIGSKKVIEMLLHGNPKLILLSKNCPDKISERIKYYAEIAKVSYIVINKNSHEFGALCGKPFSISAFGVIDEGESSILDITKKK